MSTHTDYVKVLCGTGVSEESCKQLADDLDRKDAEIARLKKENLRLAEIIATREILDD